MNLGKNVQDTRLHNMHTTDKVSYWGYWGAEIGTNHKMDTLSNQNSHKLAFVAD